MPEIQNERKIFSLLEVSQSIQRTLAERYGSVFWVKAEMNKLNHYPRSGHCYPDLVEKKDGKVIAQLRATLWKDDYHRINHSFMRVVKVPLKEGISMLCCARVMFDPVHGLSLRIMDIDPVFSLGELEREKQETIDRLRDEGIFERNRTLQFPLLPQRVAIISVETSKGYADFLKVIDHNPVGYRFFHFLFPSLLQGERAVDSILYQLKRIKTVISHFDVVAIIRGGGGEVGLSCFNDYQLAREIATFPIPVVTGIGHATNETVVEMIAHKNGITPTDLANFLVDRFDEFAIPVLQAQETLVDKARHIVNNEGQHIRNVAKYFRSVTGNLVMRSRHAIHDFSRAVVHQSRFQLHREKELQNSLKFDLRRTAMAFCNQCRLAIHTGIISIKKDLVTVVRDRSQDIDILERNVNNMSPQVVLRRGYSITMVNGKAVKNSGELQIGDRLKTILSEGEIESEVTVVKKPRNA